MQWAVLNTVAIREPKLAPLAALLGRVRRRASLLLFARGVLWALVAAGLAYTLTILFPTTPLQPLAAALVVSAVALSVAAAIAVMRTPTLLELAQEADLKFRLGERTSTALEVAVRPHGPTLVAEVAAALIDDAARHAERIEPNLLFQLRLTRVMWLLLGVALLAFASSVALPTMQGLRPSPLPKVTIPLDPAAREALLADVRRSAELLGLEAEERSDPYLKAVADAFIDLGERLEAGTIEAGEAEAELGRLLEHAAQALGIEPPEQANAIPPLEAAEEVGEVNSSASGTETSLDLADLLEGLEESEQARLAREEAAAAGGDYFENADLQGPNPLSQQGRIDVAAENGRITGVAQQSQQGPGPIGGEGTQPLEGEGASPPLFGAESMKVQVLLPGFAPDAQERVEMTLTPETELTDVAVASVVAPSVITPARETELRHDQLSPRDLVVARRYFDRSLVSDPVVGAQEDR